MVLLLAKSWDLKLAFLGEALSNLSRFRFGSEAAISRTDQSPAKRSGLGVASCQFVDLKLEPGLLTSCPLCLCSSRTGLEDGFGR